VFAGLRCALKGAYQQQNGSVAVAAALLLRDFGFQIDAPAIAEGLASVFWPGRMEYFHRETAPGLNPADRTGRWYLLDGAHNPDGVKNLAASLQADFSGRRLVCVWGAMGDKDIAGALALIAPAVDELILTSPAGERSARPEQLLACLAPEQRGKALCAPDIASALAQAGRTAGPDDLVVVAGSLYLVGEARRILCGEVVDG
jgi:dihydrofolate synthase/folylpolyglutamate synthase